MSSNDRRNTDDLQFSADGKPIKIDKWNGTAVKNALDDAVRTIMTEYFKYEENHSLMDRRLVICTIACLFAVTALIYDYLFPFPESRSVLAICVLSYFFMMGVLTLYTTYVEQNHFLVVHNKDPAGVDQDKVWTIDSMMKRFDDKYSLEMQFIDAENKFKVNKSVTKSVGAWFDEEGTLQGDAFLKDVCDLHDSLTAEKKKN